MVEDLKMMLNCNKYILAYVTKKKITFSILFDKIRLILLLKHILILFN